MIGTVRRECLDWVIPLNERQLRRVLAEWCPHYNRGFRLIRAGMFSQSRRPRTSASPTRPELAKNSVLITAREQVRLNLSRYQIEGTDRKGSIVQKSKARHLRAPLATCQPAPAMRQGPIR